MARAQLAQPAFETRIEDLLRAHKWGKNFNIAVGSDPSLISAGTETKGSWRIHVNIDPRLERLEDLLAKFRPTGSSLWSRFASGTNYFTGKANLDNVLYFVVSHEIGHWKWCPFDVDSEEEILSGVSDGFGEIGFSKEEIEKYAYITFNSFADIIENTINMYRDRQNERYTDGLLAFYAKSGILKPYSDQFAIFVDANVKLGVNNPAMKDFAAAFSENYASLEGKTLEIVKVLVGNDALAEKVAASKVTLEEKIEIYKALADKGKWHNKAKEFAKIIGPYVRGKSEEDLESQTPCRGQMQHSTPEGQREHIRKSLEKGRMPEYASDSIVLDELYKQRAEQILMEMQKQRHESASRPIAHLQRREIGENEGGLENIDFENPGIAFGKGGDAQLEFFRKEAPLVTQSKGAEIGAGIRDILFVFDTSGSMTADYDPKAGAGPYDLLLRSAYSVFKHLEDKGLAPHMRFATVLFNGKPNYFSGWHTYYEMQNTKNPLLMPGKFPTGNIGTGTDLDEKVIRQATDESSDKFWAIIVSDGEIYNTEEAQRAASYLASKGNEIDFVIVGGVLGNASRQFSGHVKKVGGRVHAVKTPADLPRLFLGRARQLYSEN